MNLRKYLFFILLNLIVFNFAAFANIECEAILNPSKNSIVKPLLSAVKTLNLPTGFNRQESKTKTSVNEEIFNLLSFFRPSLEKLNGGQDLFKLFESLDGLSSEQIKIVLNRWASIYLPGYEILFLDDVRSYNFKNSYPKKNAKIYNAESGILDEKFLFELYANKKIPILNVTDLVSKILVLAIPRLREQFEKLINLYQRGQSLGDLNEDDLMYSVPRVNRPYSNNYRLSYISAIVEFLTSRLIFLSPYSNQRQIVFFGSANLESTTLDLNSVNLATSLDLSLNYKLRALEYFNKLAFENNRSVWGLFNFLIKAQLLSKPVKDHMSNPKASHKSISEQSSYFDMIRVEANIESKRQNDNEEQTWIRFSNFVYHSRSHNIAQISRYAFRLDWIEHYIRIVESDIISTENTSQREQPGPLFR